MIKTYRRCISITSQAIKSYCWWIFSMVNPHYYQKKRNILSISKLTKLNPLL